MTRKQQPTDEELSKAKFPPDLDITTVSRWLKIHTGRMDYESVAIASAILALAGAVLEVAWAAHGEAEWAVTGTARRPGKSAEEPPWIKAQKGERP